MEKIIYLLLAFEEQKTLKFLKKYRSLVQQNFSKTQQSVSEKLKRKLKKAFEKNKQYISLSSARDADPSARDAVPPSSARVADPARVTNSSGGLSARVAVPPARVADPPARDADPAVPSEKDVSAWQNFCKHAPYEEALALVLCGILNHSQEKITWLFKIPPEILSYRLKKGFSLLKAELEGAGTLNKSPDPKDVKRANPLSPSPSPPSPPSSLSQKEVLAYCDFLSKKPLPSHLKYTQSWSLNYKVIFYLLLGFFIVLLVFWLFRLFSSSPVILYPDY